MTEKKSLIGTNGNDPNTFIGEGGKDDYGNYFSAVKHIRWRIFIYSSK